MCLGDGFLFCFVLFCIEIARCFISFMDLYIQFLPQFWKLLSYYSLTCSLLPSSFLLLEYPLFLCWLFQWTQTVLIGFLYFLKFGSLSSSTWIISIFLSSSSLILSFISSALCPMHSFISSAFIEVSTLEFIFGTLLGSESFQWSTPLCLWDHCVNFLNFLIVCWISL